MGGWDCAEISCIPRVGMASLEIVSTRVNITTSCTQAHLARFRTKGWPFGARPCLCWPSCLPWRAGGPGGDPGPYGTIQRPFILRTSVDGQSGAATAPWGHAALTGGPPESGSITGVVVREQAGV